jgi:hypothetical protein
MSALDDIRARAEAATEGPWEWDGNDIDQCGTRWGSVVENTVSCMSYCYGGSVEQEVKPADREFIAHARQDIPRLLAALDAVTTYCAEEQTGSGEVSADGVIDAIDSALKGGAA